MINRMFSPEFRNRLDATIGFKNLSPVIMNKVVGKFIMELEAQLSDRDVSIEIDDESCRWLAKKGYDDQFGARPLARVIQDQIKKPLAEELLFGKISKGGTVKVSIKEGKLKFRLTQNRPKKISGSSSKKSEIKKPELVKK